MFRDGEAQLFRTYAQEPEQFLVFLLVNAKESHPVSHFIINVVLLN